MRLSLQACVACLFRIRPAAKYNMSALREWVAGSCCWCPSSLDSPEQAARSGKHTASPSMLACLSTRTLARRLQLSSFERLGPAVGNLNSPNSRFSKRRPRSAFCVSVTSFCCRLLYNSTCTTMSRLGKRGCTVLVLIMSQPKREIHE